MRPITPRVLAAMPDALSATVFLWAWIDPAKIGGPARVKNLMLTMLFEFIVMHSSAMIGSMVISDMSRAGKFLAMAGLSAAYLLFVLAFAAAFSSSWPIWVFGWLFVCRFWYLLANRTTSEDAAKRMQTAWGISAGTYLAGCFITLFLPLPRLAITPDFVTAMQFPHGMSGDWVDHPWKVLAFGALYFGVLAWSKFNELWLPAPADTPRPGKAAA
ncbi:hypothetical protein [Dokdonella sp.]|uniref:hypothetical protein n=1 Tax=Dokdonella sp. TaxID=2291710 RepID=UPI003784CA5F